MSEDAALYGGKHCRNACTAGAIMLVARDAQISESWVLSQVADFRY